ncbi:MAG: benzoyl-CoA reductase subunit C [Bacteroidetes bacterium]|nr:benzoyl-CoA reductase subunit C [Bacteroidota bacterium]
MKTLKQTIDKCKELSFDLNFTEAKNWKGKDNNRALIGYMPIYFPREIAHASNCLAVGILGTGDRKRIIKGDAYYQSYICRIPRGIIELALDKHFEGFDGFIFPSICDVIRNLSGMFKLLNIGNFVSYLDYPQNFNPNIGGEFYKNEINNILTNIKKINNAEVTTEKLNHSISLYNKNRKLITSIYDARQKFPWRLSAEELYYVIRAGMVIPVEDHNIILEQVYDFIQENFGEPIDKIRVIVYGSFCEQPPVSLIKTIELAGCYVVDDDFLIGSRWIEGNIDDNTDDPINAIVNAFLTKSTFSSSLYDVNNPKEDRLIELFNKRNADGIIFAAASFCDPALLDRPTLQNACEKNNIRYISFQFSENIGEFKNIKEQVGAFSDSIKLWDDELIEN